MRTQPGEAVTMVGLYVPVGRVLTLCTNSPLLQDPKELTEFKGLCQSSDEKQAVTLTIIKHVCTCIHEI